MITAKDLKFEFVSSLSADKQHALLYINRQHNVKAEIVTSGRTIGGIFKPKEEKRYYYRNVKDSTVHESMKSMLEELNA